MDSRLHTSWASRRRSSSSQGGRGTVVQSQKVQEEQAQIQDINIVVAGPGVALFFKCCFCTYLLRLGIVWGWGLGYVGWELFGGGG